MSKRVRIGDMLVQASMLTPEKLEQALALQKQLGRRLGEILVEQGFVTESQLTQTLSNQLSVPWVSLYHVDFTRALLNYVPRDLAERYCLVPVYVRAVRREGDTLYIAMDDPTNDEAIQTVANAAVLPVKPMVAAPSEIRSVIRVYYGGQAEKARVVSPGYQAPRTSMATPTPAVRPVLPEAASSTATSVTSTAAAAAAAAAPASASGPASASAAAPVSASAPASATASATAPASATALPAASAPASATAPASGTAAATVSATAAASATAAGSAPAMVATATESAAAAADSVPMDEARGERTSSPGIAPAPRAVAAQSRAKKPRMISITLLDGTSVSLPAPGQKRVVDATPNTVDGAEDALTASDLVAALRAKAAGADVSDVLGNATWESMFAALLSVLLKKHLIADWEFVEEWKKHQR